MPSGSWLPNRSAPNSRSRGEMPRGAHRGWPKGPIISPMNMAITANICMYKRKLLMRHVLFRENFAIRVVPAMAARKYMGNTMFTGSSQTI